MSVDASTPRLTPTSARSAATWIASARCSTASSHAVDELAEKTTVTDLLAALVRHLSSEFSRVALFRVKANRLEGEHQVGFDLTTDVSKLVIPFNVDSLITRAAIWHASSS